MLSYFFIERTTYYSYLNKFKIMNKTVKFGYDSLGAYTLVKLNVKLTDYESARLEATYYNWLKFISNHKGLTRIEGVLPVDSHFEFAKDLRCAILQSKMTAMQDEINAIRYPKIPQSLNVDWTKADLDSI